MRILSASKTQWEGVVVQDLVIPPTRLPQEHLGGKGCRTSSAVYFFIIQPVGMQLYQPVQLCKEN